MNNEAHCTSKYGVCTILSCRPSPASVTSFPFSEFITFAWELRQNDTMDGISRCH